MGDPILVLIKRSDGSAWLSETLEVSLGSVQEGCERLSPDDVVDGRKVSDWPVGVFTVQRVVWEGSTERFTDWSSETLEMDADGGEDGEG